MKPLLFVSAMVCGIVWSAAATTSGGAASGGAASGGAASGGAASGEPKTTPAKNQPKAFKAIVHVNFADSERQKHGLKNVANMLKGVKEKADIEVVCHGSGISLVVKDQSRHAAEVERLVKQGVRFAACENTMRDKSIAKDSLLPGVGTVPSGAVEIIRKQQEGYGYFRP